jgi:HK97 family phage prohead protease
MKMKCLDYKFNVKRQNGNHIVIEGLANAATVDRANELISPKAWEMDNFKKNPIVLFNHGHDPQFGYMPVGYAMDVRATDEGLYTKIKLSNSNTEKIRAVRDLVEEGVLKTFSVGFEPLDGTKADNGNHQVITKAQLIEISIVPIPMNQDSTFSLLSKSYNYVRTNIAKSWISSHLLSTELAQKGFYFASAIHQRIHDLKQDDVVKSVSDISGLQQDVILGILVGNVEEIPQTAIDAFSKFLKIDKLFLEKLAKKDVVTLNINTKDDNMEPMDNQDQETPAEDKPEQMVQSIKVAKDKYPNIEDAKKVVSDAGYSVDKVEEDDVAFTFVQNEMDDAMMQNAETMEIGDGVYAVVCSMEKACATDEEKPAEEKEMDEGAQKLVDAYNSAMSSVDETLMEQAKAASQSAFGKEDAAFIAWYCFGQKPAEKMYIQKAEIPPVDDNPYLEQARQTNVLLGTLIKEIQGMSVKLDGMPAKQLEQIKEEQKPSDAPVVSDEEKSLLINIRSYQQTIKDKLKNIGA